MKKPDRLWQYDYRSAKAEGHTRGILINMEIQSFIDLKGAFSIQVREPPKGTYNVASLSRLDPFGRSEPSPDCSNVTQPP